MPTIAAEMQKRFKLTIIDDLPEAAVEITGQVHWVKCCPLCGCSHQLIKVDENIPYTPMCQTVPLLFKDQQASWRKLYPDVIKYTAMRLVQPAGD